LMQLVYSIHFYVHSSCNYILLYLCSSITEEINKYRIDYNEQDVDCSVLVPYNVWNWSEL